MCESLPILDKNKALQVAAGKESLANELLAILIRDLPNNKRAIQQQLDNNNRDELRKVIHKLHGGLRYVGAPALLEITSATDQHLFELTDEQLQQNIIRIHDEIDRVLEKEYYA